jgi:hypothetical protein
MLLHQSKIKTNFEKGKKEDNLSHTYTKGFTVAVVADR